MNGQQNTATYCKHHSEKDKYRVSNVVFNAKVTFWRNDDDDVHFLVR